MGPSVVVVVMGVVVILGVVVSGIITMAGVHARPMVSATDNV